MVKSYKVLGLLRRVFPLFNCPLTKKGSLHNFGSLLLLYCSPICRPHLPFSTCTLEAECRGGPLNSFSTTTFPTVVFVSATFISYIPLLMVLYILFFIKCLKERKMLYLKPGKNKSYEPCSYIQVSQK